MRRKAIAGGLVVGLFLVCWMLLVWPREAIRKKSLAALDDVLARSRRTDLTVDQSEWQRAVSLAERALALDPDDTTRGKLRLCEGHVARISGTTLNQLVDLNLAVVKFTEAQRLLPRSPDPQLGLAELYLRGLHDPDRARMALTRAGALGYTTGDRETRLLADGYRERADLRVGSARLAGTPAMARERLQQAHNDYQKALELYRALGSYGDAETVKSRLAEVGR